MSTLSKPQEKFIGKLEDMILHDPILMFGARAFDKPKVPEIPPRKQLVPFARKPDIVPTRH